MYNYELEEPRGRQAPAYAKASSRQASLFFGYRARGVSCKRVYTLPLTTNALLLTNKRFRYSDFKLRNS